MADADNPPGFSADPDGGVDRKIDDAVSTTFSFLLKATQPPRGPGNVSFGVLSLPDISRRTFAPGAFLGPRVPSPRSVHVCIAHLYAFRGEYRGLLHELRTFYDRARGQGDRRRRSLLLAVAVAATTRNRAGFDGVEEGEGAGKGGEGNDKGGRVYAVTRVARFQECRARSEPMPAARQ